MENVIYSYQIEVEQDREFGNIFRITCPSCHGTATLLQYLSNNPSRICSCGYEWSVKLQAIGRKPDLQGRS